MADSGFLREVGDDEDPEAFARSRAELVERCNVANIKCFDDPDHWDPDQPVGLWILLPAGRDEHHLLVYDAAVADALLSVPFENHRILGDYAGICSYADGTIEVGVRAVRSILPPESLWKHGISGSATAPYPRNIGGHQSPMALRLGSPSPEFSAFQAGSGWRSSVTLSVGGASIDGFDRAVALIEKLASSLFFSIDLNAGEPLELEHQRWALPRLADLRRGRPSVGLAFPARQYDREPMSLYWYARAATGMPLLQFLAYYQILEYYMPTCSNQEAISLARNVLKDPRFNPDSDTEVGRVLSILAPTGKGLGDERSQLAAVVRRCINPSDLREFFISDPDTQVYYEKEFKPIALQQIPLRDTASDLTTETANRLYEIRCRIVHTKHSDGRDLGPLLPNSPESGDLCYDIALAQAIARAALVAASAPMSLE